MDDNNTHPEHLLPFFDGTPLALERIRSAWKGLAMADRVYLLSVLLPDRGSHPNALVWKRHCEALIDLALEDENAYIRYLAAKRVAKPDKHSDPAAWNRINKIDADSSPLVRSAQAEAGTIWPLFEKVSIPGQHAVLESFNNYSPSAFWKSHQVYRLAAATTGDSNFSVTDLLRYATKELLPSGTVTLDEMADLLLQALGPDHVQRFAQKKPRAGRSYSHFKKEVEELWKCIPDIPKDLSYILLRCLPEGTQYSPIPPGVFESLDDDQLGWFLSRDDVALKELRRKIYTESTNEKLRYSAVASAKFELLDSDISRLVFDPDEPKEARDKKVKELDILACNGRSANLVQMGAVCHLLCLSDSIRSGRGYDLQSERAKRLWNGGLGRSALQQEILPMRVFELAKGLSPVEINEAPSQLPESLKAHQQLVTPHNPWQTHLNLWQAVPLTRWKEIIADLPTVSIRDFDLPD